MEWMDKDYVMVLGGIVYMLLELWLGETSKIKGNSLAKAIWNGVKKLWPGNWKSIEPKK